MNRVDAYDALYANMKNKFTVVNEGNEYSLGEYMLMKATKKKQGSNLPATRTNTTNTTVVSAFFRYVNDKLTLKAPPAKDKVIKKFPFRTSFAALVSAIVTCTLVITYGTVALKSITQETPTAVNSQIAESEKKEDKIFTTQK